MHTAGVSLSIKKYDFQEAGELEHINNEIRKEAAFEQASVAHAKKLYEDLLKSHRKKWADRMKSDLKDIARSKIEAELKKRYSVTPKTILKTKNQVLRFEVFSVISIDLWLHSQP